MEDSHFNTAMRGRVDRVMRDANSLFSLGNIREQCQKALVDYYSSQPLSPYSDYGHELYCNREYRFAHSLTSTYGSTKSEIVQWVNGCAGEYLLAEVQEERAKLIYEFVRMKIAYRWYQMKDDDKAWRVFAQNVPYGDASMEEDIRSFFETLDRICILTDILMGHADMYGIKVDYPNETDTKVELNYAGPEINMQHLLRQAWFLKARSNERFDDQWTDNFVSDIMASEWRDVIAQDWAVKDKRLKLKCMIVGALRDAGVLKGSYNGISKLWEFDDEGTATLANYMGQGKKQVYAQWISDYVEEH